MASAKTRSTFVPQSGVCNYLRWLSFRKGFLMASAEQLRVCFEVLQLYRALGSCTGS